MKAVSVFNNRTLCLGIAIIMVVMYHLFCMCKVPPLNIFYPGFLGVDIFLFFSGFGLCYSYQKNSLQTFYKRRFKRILPLYIISALIISIIELIDGRHLSFFDIICNLTSLSYWGVGGCFIDWYLSSLIVLYIAFPVMFKFTNSGGVIALFVLVVITISVCFHPDWKYECLIGRIPIFCSGILCFNNKTAFNRVVLPLYCVGFILTLVLYKFHYVHTYLVFYMLAPIVLIAIVYVLEMVKSSRMRNVIDVLGRRSLEIYTSNLLVLKLASRFETGPMIIIPYFILNIVIALIFCYCNDYIQNILCKRK